MQKIAAVAAFCASLFGCATRPAEAPPLAAALTAAAFDARSLSDAALRRFLAENLRPAPEGQGAWDFETLAWVAFYFNPSLDVARAQWATARATQKTAAARPNPTLSLAPGYNSTRVPGVSPWFPAVNFDFLLTGNTKRARQQDIARAEAEVARLAVLAAAWQVRSELRRALLEVQTLSARESHLREQALLQDKLAALIAQRLAAGRANSSEASAARLASLRLHAALGEAAAQLAVTRPRLAAALGLPLTALDGQLFSVFSAPALSGEAVAAARRESLQSRADVLAALAKFHSAHAAVELETAKQQPDFHLGPGYQWDQGSNKWSLALTFEVPLFHRNEGPIAEAVARRAEAIAQFNLTQAQAIAAIDSALAAQAAAAAQLASARSLRAEIAAQTARVGQRQALGAADQVERQAAALELAAATAVLTDAEAAATLAAGQLEDALQLSFPHLAALADAARPPLTRTP